MRKSSALLLFICSVILACMSPALVSLGPDYADPSSRSGVFFTWFYRLPIAVDQWVWPEGDGLMLGLAVAVYALQYLAVTAALLVGIALAKHVSDAL